MRFVVPQFIEHDPPIFGSLTFRQFVFAGISGLTCFIIYFIVPLPVFIIAALVIGIVTAAFIFIKIGGKSLASLLSNLLKFSVSPKIYVWQKNKPKEMTTIFKKDLNSADESAAESEILPMKKDAQGKLRQLEKQVDLNKR